MTTDDRLTEAEDKLQTLGFDLRLDDATRRKIATKGFGRATLPQTIVLAQILNDEGPISVRGAFYRAVSAGVYPDTADKHYRAAGIAILKLRRLGIISYDKVSDSTRVRDKPSSWVNLNDFANTVRRAYRKDLWCGQSSHVEVAVEKDAMFGVLSPVTHDLDVNLNVIRGAASETFVWTWAESLMEIDLPITIYYLGDHDPSGLQIERDLRSRLEGFLDGEPVNWQRLAINAEDFHRADLIGFPIKKARDGSLRPHDRDYHAAFGDKCIEVDAIPATEIRERLKEAINQHIDTDAWERLSEAETVESETLAAWTFDE